MLRNILIETVTDWLDSRKCVVSRKVALTANFVRLSVVLCTLTVLPAAPVFSQTDPSPAVRRRDDQEEIKQAIVSRGDAFAAGDCEKFESFVTTDVIEIEGGLVTPHEVLTKECRGRNAIPDFKQESFRSDFQFRFLGDVVVVTYVGEKVEHIGELTPVESYRGVDVLKKQNGKWLLSVFTERSSGAKDQSDKTG